MSSKTKLNARSHATMTDAERQKLRDQAERLAAVECFVKHGYWPHIVCSTPSPGTPLKTAAMMRSAASEVFTMIRAYRTCETQFEHGASVSLAMDRLFTERLAFYPREHVADALHAVLENWTTAREAAGLPKIGVEEFAQSEVIRRSRTKHQQQN